MMGGEGFPDRTLTDSTKAPTPSLRDTLASPLHESMDVHVTTRVLYALGKGGVRSSSEETLAPCGSFAR
ncbi:hypothetical protein B0T14DRAFT_136433 [Immersiella caudata]|uniref:Uncharacterized protein n=1 Tax=Immersiella caudata TaxID=314043 RepID=A0AA40C746_9PEZI|nr:hypothetical protein B0T14DRAFT_136433 [Immersiella caudata]